MDLAKALDYAPDTAQFVTGEVIDQCGDIYVANFGKETAFIVADENTFKAAGEEAVTHLTRAGVPLAEPHIFPGSPVLPCDYSIIEDLREEIKSRGQIPIAVGSGTLNDLVKVAAFECDMRYMVIATAASVDGYSAPGASIVKDGFKNSIYCRAPHAIVADVNILRSAPSAMTAAGYADLSSKYTAGADWIIADWLKVDPIDDVCWQIVQDDLDSWVKDPEGVAEHRPGAFSDLFLGLTMTGVSMQRARRSRPASGAEHLMSHIWEMRHLTIDGAPVSHGFKVAIATLSMTALMERIFSKDSIDGLEPGWIDWPAKQQKIMDVFDQPVRAGALSETQAKHVEKPGFEERMRRAKTVWQEMKTDMEKKLPAYSDLRRRFERVGAPVRPETIGLEREEVLSTFELAGMIRNRYTAIDLAVDLGILDECINEIRRSDEYLR